MFCVKCGLSIYSPEKNDVVYDTVIAETTSQSSHTQHYASGQSTTTFSSYRFMAREKFVFCSRCSSKPRKLHRIIVRSSLIFGFIGFSLAFIIPFIPAIDMPAITHFFSLPLVMWLVVILMGLGLFGAIGASCITRDGSIEAANYLREKYNPYNNLAIKMFSPEEWEKMR